MSGNTFPEHQTALILTALRKVLLRQAKYAISILLTHIFTVSTVLMLVEHWSFGQSLYFTFSATTTIGYGDVVPRSVLGKSLFIWFLAFGIGLMTYMGSIIAELISNQWRIHVETE